MRSGDDKDQNQKLMARATRSLDPQSPAAAPCTSGFRRPVCFSLTMRSNPLSRVLPLPPLPAQAAYKDNDRLSKENRQLEAANTELRARRQTPHTRQPTTPLSPPPPPSPLESAVNKQP